MKTIRKMALVLCALVPVSASAEVVHYSLCTLSGDSTIQDVQAWMKDWRVAVNKAGIKYKIRLLVGHSADAEEMPPNFYIEGSSANLSDYADAWSWWYSDDAGAVASNQQLFSLVSCGNQGVFRTLE